MKTPHHFRAMTRFPVRWAATLETLSERQLGPLPATLVDLGPSGARLELDLDRSFPPGFSVVLYAELPNLWLPLTLNGVVVWSRQDLGRLTVGVRFVNQSPAVLHAIIGAVCPSL